MVNGMVRRAVDDGMQELRDFVQSVVNGRRPHVDEDIQPEVDEFVQRE